MRRKHPFPFIPFLVVVVCAPAWAGIGTITTIAGGGPKNVQATRAHLHNPTDVVTDSQETSTLSPRVRTKYSGWMLPPACLSLLRVAIPMVSVAITARPSKRA